MSIGARLGSLRDRMPKWLLFAVKRVLPRGLWPSIPQPWQRYFKVEPGDTVLDVGASIGEFAVRAAKMASGGSVIAIEPEPANLAALERNTSHLGNVKIMRVAVMDYEGDGELHLNPVNRGGHSMIKAIVGVGDEGEVTSRDSLSVPVRTLDSLAAELGLERVDFMKMDIEGGELAALRGGERLLRNVNKIVVEAYHPLDGHPTAPRVKEILERAGFSNITISKDNWVYAWRSAGR